MRRTIHIIYDTCSRVYYYNTDPIRTLSHIITVIVTSGNVGKQVCNAAGRTSRISRLHVQHTYYNYYHTVSKLNMCCFFFIILFLSDVLCNTASPNIVWIIKNKNTNP